MSIYQMKTINLLNQNWFSSSDKIFENQKNCVAKVPFRVFDKLKSEIQNFDIRINTNFILHLKI